MKKIKVLHYGLSNHLGGIETFLYNLAVNLDPVKYQTDFLIIGNEIPCFYNELKKIGCNFYFVTSRRQNFFKSREEIKNLLKKQSYDLVHCHCNTLSYIEPVLVANQLGIKVIVHSRNGGAKISMHSSLMHKINQFILPYNKIHLLAVSTEAGKWMFKKKKFDVINNGVDLEKYRYSETLRNSIRKELNIQDSTVLIMIGAFRKQKNHNFAINIMKELCNISGKYKLLLLGDGKLKESIEKLVKELQIEDNVLFLGNQNNIQPYLSAADYFLFPSFYEGFPNALLEAEANGLLCFASNTITREVQVNNMISYLDLNDGVSAWAKTIKENHNKINRENSIIDLIKLGKDKKTEINNITRYYQRILDEE